MATGTHAQLTSFVNMPSSSGYDYLGTCFSLLECCRLSTSRPGPLVDRAPPQLAKHCPWKARCSGKCCLTAQPSRPEKQHERTGNADQTACGPGGVAAAGVCG